GIRDRNVTGVQTCALPILMVLHGFIISTVGIFIASFGSGGTISVKDAILSIFRIPVIYGAAAGLLFQLMDITIDDKLMDILQMRSEERRVGRGCASLGGMQ